MLVPHIMMCLHNSNKVLQALIHGRHIGLKLYSCVSFAACPFMHSALQLQHAAPEAVSAALHKLRMAQVCGCGNLQLRRLFLITPFLKARHQR